MSDQTNIQSKLINYGFGFPACFKFIFENITPFLTEKILTGHPHDFLIKISLNLIAGILPVRTRGSREGDRFKSVRDSHRSIKKKSHRSVYFQRKLTKTVHTQYLHSKMQSG